MNLMESVEVMTLKRQRDAYLRSVVLLRTALKDLMASYRSVVEAEVKETFKVHHPTGDDNLGDMSYGRAKRALRQTETAEVEAKRVLCS